MSRFSGIFPGVSTACFYPEVTEVAFDYLASNGVQGIEVFSNCRWEISKEFLAPLKKQAEATGVKIVGLHPYTSGEEGRLFFGQYPRRTAESREFYKAYYEACAFLETDALVFHGDWLALLPIEEYLERIALLTEDAKPYGVHICLENVWRFRSSSPDLFQEVRRELPDTKYILDIKQAVLADHHPKDFLEAMGAENIHHIHFSDNNKRSACLPPGEGTFDLQGFVRDLQRSGYQGGLILELYRHNYVDYSELLDSYAYIQKLIDQG